MGIYNPCAKKKALIQYAENVGATKSLQLHQEYFNRVYMDMKKSKEVQLVADAIEKLHVNKNYNSLEWHKKSFTDDVVVKWGWEAGGEIVATGIEALQKTHAAWYVPMPDLNVHSCFGLALDGNRVVIQCKLSAEKSGIKDVVGSNIVELKDGKIAKGRWFWDYTYITTKNGMYTPSCEEHNKKLRALATEYADTVSTDTTNDANTVAWHKKFFSKDVVMDWGWAVSPIQAKGIEAVQKVHGGFHAPNPDLRMTTKGAYGSANTVYLQASLNCLSRGIKSANGAGLFEFEGGLIKKGRWFWDFTYLTTKMGIYNPCAKKSALLQYAETSGVDA